MFLLVENKTFNFLHFYDFFPFLYKTSLAREPLKISSLVFVSMALALKDYFNSMPFSNGGGARFIEIIVIQTKIINKQIKV